MKNMMLLFLLFSSTVVFSASSGTKAIKKDPPLNITIRPVSIGDQMRGKYAGKSIAEVVIKTAQGEELQLLENERWRLNADNDLLISKKPHETIAQILVTVNAYAYPRRILVIE